MGLVDLWQFSDLNWLAVLVAAVSAFVVGGVWYNSKWRMGKAWLAENRFTKKQMQQAESKEAMTGHITITFFVNVLQSFLLASVLTGLGIVNGWEGFLFGAVAGMVWSAGSLAVNYAYALKTLRLYAVDAGYIITNFGLMGFILGAWQ